MTAVGKILVVMNLLFSVACVALIVQVFSTRTNWKNEYEKVARLALVAEAAYKQEKLAHEADLRGRDSQVVTQENLQKESETNSKTADTRREEVEKSNRDFVAENKKLANDRAILDTQVETLQKERDLLVKDRETVRARVLEVQKELNEQRLFATNKQIESDSLGARNRRMADRIEELERDSASMRARLNAGGGGAQTGQPSILSPGPVAPPRDVKGTVRAVASSGLTVINIGSDSGLSAGNKLEIYRIDAQNPKNSVYLGELVLGRTEPKQAVGQFYPKPFAKPDERLPKVDDIASTSLGNR